MELKKINQFISDQADKSRASEVLYSLHHNAEFEEEKRFFTDMIKSGNVRQSGQYYMFKNDTNFSPHSEPVFYLISIPVPNLQMDGDSLISTIRVNYIIIGNIWFSVDRSVDIEHILTCSDNTLSVSLTPEKKLYGISMYIKNLPYCSDMVEHCVQFSHIRPVLKSNDPEVAGSFTLANRTTSILKNDLASIMAKEASITKSGLNIDEDWLIKEYASSLSALKKIEEALGKIKDGKKIILVGHNGEYGFSTVKDFEILLIGDDTVYVYKMSEQGCKNCFSLYNTFNHAGTNTEFYQYILKPVVLLDSRTQFDSMLEVFSTDPEDFNLRAYIRFLFILIKDSLSSTVDMSISMCSRPCYPDECKAVAKFIQEYFMKWITRRNNSIKFFSEMTPFESKEDIPSIPGDLDDEWRKIIVDNLIRCGAIPRSELEIGKSYLGSCRNSIRAKWNGEEFVYDRTKFGTTYQDSINHFEDDNGYDVFIPIKLIK